MTTATAILLLALSGGVLLVLGGWLLVGKRRTPEEQERSRRAFLTARGRMLDAEVTEFHDNLVGYSYEVSGVTYHVVQDVTPFHDLLPRDASLLIGPAVIKYLPANPANSILISEGWSGIRVARPAVGKKGA
ncbi:MAG: hypothetical protein JNK87_32940 [Bryobacterales bacterium]|nr:hypothetical protein [Bryobacterales bacterium]